MRAVVQRVQFAKVTVDDQTVGQIEKGLLVLVAAGEQDNEASAETLADKIVKLRIFSDEKGLMNKSLIDVNGSLLAVSQFTLFGDCRHGRRPSFSTAARPEIARPLYDHFVQAIRNLGVHCETGIFQADMQVTLQNDGPVTLLLDTTKLF